MIDEDDALLATVLASDSAFGPVSGFVVLVFLGFIWWGACHDKAECQQMHCAHGAPVIVAHECACVEAAHK